MFEALRTMTAYEALSLVVGALGVAAILWSLRLLREQIKMLRDQSQHLTRAFHLSAESALDTQFVVVTQAYLDHPELRAVLNSNEPTPKRLTRDTRLRASALAETLCDSMERALKLRDVGVTEYADSLRRWINDSFEQSEFLRDWLLERSHWYSGELVAIARRGERRQAAP